MARVYASLANILSIGREVNDDAFIAVLAMSICDIEGFVFCEIDDPGFGLIAFGAFGFALSAAYGRTDTAGFRGINIIEPEFYGAINASAIAI